MALEGGKAVNQAVGKMGGPNLGPPWKLTVLSGREVGGKRGVAVKYIHITQNSECEGSLPAPN